MRIVIIIALAFIMATTAAQARVVVQPPAQKYIVLKPPAHDYIILRPHVSVQRRHGSTLTQPHLVVGMASWYGLHDGSGRVTASGKRFDPYAMGVAHASWPFGTRLRMTAVSTGQSIIVTVLDRTGPGVARNGRVFDLYYGAARSLGIVGQGSAMVRAEPMGADNVREALADPLVR